MVLFAICMPLAVLAILGMIYGGEPAFEGAGYTFLEQSFGALASISICAGGVMGLPLVVSDYRLSLIHIFFGLRHLKDAQEIRALADPAEKILIVGSGLVGMDAAYAFLEQGKEVTVVEMEMCIRDSRVPVP